MYNIVKDILRRDTMFVVENEFKCANISRTIRFTEGLFEELNQIAAKNEVSFNLLVLQCCKYAISQMEDVPKENV